MSAYISRKISHMQQMGIPADIGPNGGACPNWLKELGEEDGKRQRRRNRRYEAARETAAVEANHLLEAAE